MQSTANIIIGDESALFAHLHSDGLEKFGAVAVRDNPLLQSAGSSEDFEHFNPGHPLYGGTPVSVLVGKPSERRKSKRILARCCPDQLPAGSFVKLRSGLFVTSPGLTLARMGGFASDVKLAEMAMNLCGRYYIDYKTGEIEDRSKYIATPSQLSKYLERVSSIRGAVKALRSMRWVMGNSASPFETKMTLQLGIPLWKGGLGLPFTHMNYDVKAGRLSHMTHQSEFSIDLVNAYLHVGVEYDGGDTHPDASKDKRRRNELKALGWEIFPIDKNVLCDSDATVQIGKQIAQYLGIRLRFPKHWNQAYERLRAELELPI